MDAKQQVTAVCLLIVSVLLSACGPGQLFGPTVTPTPTSTPTLTPTPTSTCTPTYTPTPTETSTPTHTQPPTSTTTPSPVPLQAAWRDYTPSDFHIALPERWEAIDIDREGIDTILNRLRGLNTPWAQNTVAMFSSEALQEMMKFWARDTEPAGIGFASLNVLFQSLPFVIKSDDLCEQMPFTYQQLGATLIDSECGMEINGLDVGRFETRITLGVFVVKEYQYVYLDDRRVWTLTLVVDDTQWSKYASTFVMIAESFRVDQ